MNCLLNYRLIKCFCHTNKHVCVRPKIVLTKIEKEQQNTFKNLAVFVVPSWASSSVSFLFSCFCNNISWCVSTKITAINCRLPVSVNLCWPAGCVTKTKPLTEMKLFLNIGRSISMSILNHVSYYYSGRMHAKTKTHICSHNVIKNIAFWMLNKVYSVLCRNRSHEVIFLAQNEQAAAPEHTCQDTEEQFDYSKQEKVGICGSDWNTSTHFPLYNKRFMSNSIWQKIIWHIHLWHLWKHLIDWWFSL